MKSRALTFVSVLSLVTMGCDRLPFLGGGDSDSTAADTAQVAATAPMDTTAAPATPAQPAVTTPAQPPPAPPAQRQQATVLAPPLMDEPWMPIDTGTVAPGMSREDVVATWGPPVAERVAGNWVYLYFRNGCEVTCGTFDVVFLEAGLVVDAIVRGPGHSYTGVSSSPPGREALPTPPGGTAG